MWSTKECDQLNMFSYTNENQEGNGKSREVADLRRRLTLRGMTSLVTRKSNRWKSDTMSRNAVELHWDRYVAKLWKFCRIGVYKMGKTHTRTQLDRTFCDLPRSLEFGGPPNSVTHDKY